MLQSMPMAESRGGRRWLILVHQLPARPSNLRVRVWRRLQQVGAVVLRNSLYVLPSTEESREDFNWVREEIVASGGEVSVFDASTIDGYTDAELVQQFRTARNADYQALATEIRAAHSASGTHRRRRKPSALERDVRRFRERLATIKLRDHFASPARADAERALAEIEAAGSPSNRSAPHTKLARRDYKRRTWVTRPRPGVDRMASAWLIQRFIAPDARFSFISPGATVGRGQVPFDMPDVEFGHHGAQCTFETLMQRFAVTDPAVMSVSHVVHDLDLKETRYAMPEGAAIGRIVDGLRAAYADDHELLQRGIVVVDALYRSFASDGNRRNGRRKRR
jgi:hypothetical protein